MRKTSLIILFICITFIRLAVAEDKPQPPIKRVQNYIAVFDLEVVGKVDKDVSRPLSDSIRREIIKSGRYEVIDRSNMDRILHEQAFQMSGCTQRDCAVEAGQLLGVGKIVIGTISIVGRTFYLSLSLLNVETGKTEVVEEDTCKCEIDQLIQSSKRVAGKLLSNAKENALVPQEIHSAEQNLASEDTGQNKIISASNEEVSTPINALSSVMNDRAQDSNKGTSRAANATAVTDISGKKCFYLGLNFAESNITYSDHYKDSGSGLEGRLGYRFNDFISGELLFSAISYNSGAVGRLSSVAEASARFRLMLPVTKSLQPWLVAGYGTDGPLYGVGLDYFLHNGFFISGGFVNSRVKVNNVDVESNTLEFGFGYLF